MSSSRIIKYSSVKDHSVRDFRFETFSDHGAPADELPSDNGFMPFVGLNSQGNTALECSPHNAEKSDDSGQEEAELVCELQPCITEEEMNARSQEAYERGFEEGQRQAERGLSNVFKTLREAIEEVYAIRERIFRESEEDLLKLSILVAGKIIQQEINIDRRILSNVVTAALENISDRDEVIIRLNPEDYKLFNTHKQLCLSCTGDEKVFNLKPDDAISAGGCIVDTLMGEIDARMETQLDEIFKRLMEERRELSGISQDLLNDGEQYAYEES